MLILAVHHAHCALGILKFDDVVAYVVRRPRELDPQRVVHPLFEMGPSDFVPADTDIFGEQVHKRVQVTHIQGEGVFSGQLANGIQGLEPVQPCQHRVASHDTASAATVRPAARPENVASPTELPEA